MTSSKFVIATFVLLVVLNVVSANIQCFHCAEETGGDGVCRDQSGNKHTLVSCAQSCITHTLAPMVIDGRTHNEIIARVCTDPSYCEIGTLLLEEKMGFKTRSCTSCNTDYCNSGSATIPSFIRVGGVLVAVKYYFL